MVISHLKLQIPAYSHGYSHLLLQLIPFFILKVKLSSLLHPFSLFPSLVVEDHCRHFLSTIFSITISFPKHHIPSSEQPAPLTQIHSLAQEPCCHFASFYVCFRPPFFNKHLILLLGREAPFFLSAHQLLGEHLIGPLPGHFLPLPLVINTQPAAAIFALSKPAGFQPSFLAADTTFFLE